MSHESFAKKKTRGRVGGRRRRGGYNTNEKANEKLRKRGERQDEVMWQRTKVSQIWAVSLE